MPGISILDSTSFSTLDDAGQKAVRALFDETYQQSGRLALNNDDLFRDRKLIPVSFNFYSSKLDETNPVTFEYLIAQPIKRKALEQDLLYAFYICSAQYQLASELSLDAAESRRKSLEQYGERIIQCAHLIEELRQSAMPETPEKRHARLVNDESKQYLAYLGLTSIAPFVAKGMQAIVKGDKEAIKEWTGEGATVLIKDKRNALNSPRLYWVWAGGEVQAWISILSDCFTNKQQAKQAVSALSPVTGFLSYALYLISASIEILMVVKHTIRCSWWMSKGELELKATTGQRFKAHADLRKFSILNDGIWGLGNLACFFWLVGNGLLGYYGNVATTLLLLMDVVLSGFRYLEESRQHADEMRRYERDIGTLNTDVTKAQAANDAEKEQLLRLQLKTLKKAKERCEFEWTHKCYGLIKDWIYATALILAFAAMCCFLLSPGALLPATVSVLTIGGAALCFIFSVINDAMSGVLEIHKSRESSWRAKKDVVDHEQGLLKQFIKETDPLIKKQLYLDMKLLRAEFDYQINLAHFQKMELIHEIFIKLFVPPLVFASFIFFPLGIGVAVLVVGFALAIQSGKFYVGDKPEMAKLPALDESEYAKFAGLPAPTFDDLKNDKSSFFNKKKPAMLALCGESNDWAPVK